MSQSQYAVNIQTIRSWLQCRFGKNSSNVVGHEDISWSALAKKMSSTGGNEQIQLELGFGALLIALNHFASCCFGTLHREKKNRKRSEKDKKKKKKLIFPSFSSMSLIRNKENLNNLIFTFSYFLLIFVGK